MRVFLNLRLIYRFGNLINTDVLDPVPTAKMIQGDILDNSFHPRLQLGHILYLIKGGKYDDERIVQQIIGSLFILHIMEAYSIKLSGVLSVNVLKDMLFYSAHIIYRHKNNKRLRRKSYKFSADENLPNMTQYKIYLLSIILKHIL